MRTMEVIENFIQTTSVELSEDIDSTRAATAGLLETLREQASEEDFQDLIHALPGAEALLHTESAEIVEKNQHGLAGALGWIRGWLGGTSGEVGFLIASREAGFSPDKVGQFVASFKRFAASHAGTDVMRKVFAEAPDLEILAKSHA